MAQLYLFLLREETASAVWGDNAKEIVDVWASDTPDDFDAMLALAEAQGTPDETRAAILAALEGM